MGCRIPPRIALVIDATISAFGGAGVTFCGVDLMIGLKLLAAVIAVAMVASVGHARADEWQFSVAPYLWAVSLDGEQTVKGRAADVDVSFLDIIEESDSIFALQAHFELHNGTWGVFFDPTFMALTMDATVGPIDVDIEFDYWLVEFGAVYRVASWPQEGGADIDLELLAGGRYTSLDIDIDLTATGFATSVGGNKKWIDPFVGARTLIPLTEGVNLLLRGDVGGFGVGSDFTYNLVGTVGWDMTVFGNDATLIAGYRILYQDYEDGSGANRFAYDITTHGPIIGMNFRF